MRRLIDWVVSRNRIANSDTVTSVGLLIIRVWVGLMMSLGHGWGKLSTFGERAAEFSDPLGVGSTASLTLAVFAEFFCSLAVALGVLTRAAVIPLMTTMLVAFLIVHSDDPWRRKEMAVMYLIPFVTLFILGPGRYSIDRLFSRKQKAG